jgi:hypothetical protein
VDISRFPDVVAPFKHMQECSGVKKLLAYEKEVNEGFAKTADATIEVRRRTELPRSRTIPLRLTQPQPGVRRTAASSHAS